jgi:hypothetical protein
MRDNTMAYKIMFTLHFNDDLSVEQKRARWRQHTDVVKQIPEVVGYVQDFVLEPLPAEPTAPKQWDAIGSVIFEDKATADRVLTSPAWEAVVADANDGAFVDFSHVLGGVMDTEKPI